MGLGDWLGGAKPKKPPAIFKKKAGQDEAYYNNLIEFAAKLKPIVEASEVPLGLAYDRFERGLKRQIETFRAERPHVRALTRLGKDLELKTLEEIGQRGSQDRQNELGTDARELVSSQLDQQRMDAEMRRRDYGLTAPGVYGTGDAERAAAMAIAENNERRRTRYEGEDIRRDFLPQAEYYGDSHHRLQGILQGLTSQQADLAHARPAAFADLSSIYGGYVQDQVQPLGVQAVNSANFSHEADQRYANLQAGRSGRMLSNVIALGAAPFTGGASLSGLRVGGGADGSGASAPFAWMDSSSGFEDIGNSDILGRFSNWNTGGEGGATYSRGRQTSGAGTPGSGGRHRYSSGDSTSRLGSYKWW